MQQSKILGKSRIVIDEMSKIFARRNGVLHLLRQSERPQMPENEPNLHRVDRTRTLKSVFPEPIKLLSLRWHVRVCLIDVRSGAIETGTQRIGIPEQRY